MYKINNETVFAEEDFREKYMAYEAVATANIPRDASPRVFPEGMTMFTVMLVDAVETSCVETTNKNLKISKDGRNALKIPSFYMVRFLFFSKI